MPPFSPDDQFKFLISCIRYSHHGKVDFTAVARECNIVSKGAASKRYERMMRAHGISSHGSSKTVQSQIQTCNGKGNSSSNSNSVLGSRGKPSTSSTGASPIARAGGGLGHTKPKPSRPNSFQTENRNGMRGGSTTHYSRLVGRTPRSTDLQPAEKHGISTLNPSLHDDDEEVFATSEPAKLEPAYEPSLVSYPLAISTTSYPTLPSLTANSSLEHYQPSSLISASSVAIKSESSVDQRSPGLAQHSEVSRNENAEMPQQMSLQEATGLIAYYEPVALPEPNLKTEPESEPVGTKENPYLISGGNDGVSSGVE